MRKLESAFFGAATALVIGTGVYALEHLALPDNTGKAEACVRALGSHSLHEIQSACPKDFDSYPDNPPFLVVSDGSAGAGSPTHVPTAQGYRDYELPKAESRDADAAQVAAVASILIGLIAGGAVYGSLYDRRTVG